MTATPLPMLRYPGGKTRIAPWIIAHMPPHTTYVEPFFGGGSVLFAKPRAKVEVINDLDDRVTTLFRVIRERPDELARVVALTPYVRSALPMIQNGNGKNRRNERPLYYAHEMTDEDHHALIDALQAHPGPVLLSGYRCALYDDQLAGWIRVDRDVYTYRQAGRTESLWLNRHAIAPQRTLFALAGMTV